MNANETNEALRRELFAALKGVQDKEAPMDLAKARAVCEISGQIIASARVDIEFARVTGRKTSGGFFPAESEALPSLPDRAGESNETSTGRKEFTPLPGGSLTVHRMR